MFANLGPCGQQFFSFSLKLVPSEGADSQNPLGMQTTGVRYAEPRT